MGHDGGSVVGDHHHLHPIVEAEIADGGTIGMMLHRRWSLGHGSPFWLGAVRPQDVR